MTTLFGDPVGSMSVFGPPGDEEPPVGSRPIHDVPAIRQAVYDRSLDAISRSPDVTNQKFTLRLSRPQYVDPPTFTRRQEKEALLTGRSLNRRVKGTWELLDNATGHVLDKKTSIVTAVPYVNSRGLFINRGTEYSLSNQQRLRSGIFGRIRENGEVEAHVNVLPGQGLPHRYQIDPDKGVFYAHVAQAKIPLYPLLKASGVTDDQMRAAWGDERIWESNKSLAKEDVALGKFYDRFSGRRADPSLTTADKVAALREILEKTPLDPNVTRRTLGQAFDRLSPQAILATTAKLAKMVRGEAEPDDRDQLYYQTLVGPEDLIAERFLKDAGHLRRQLLWKATQDGSLKSLPTNALRKQAEAALLHSGLGMALEEINAAEIRDKLSRVTRIGEGAIGSIDAVPEEARSVQTSHLGFVDLVRTPESDRAGIDLQIASNVRKGLDNQLYARFRDTKTGRRVWRNPLQLADAVVAFPEEMAKRKGNSVAVIRKGKFDWADRSEVDYELPNMESSFSDLSHVIPAKESDKGQRVSMGGRMLTQALPLVAGEAPLVRVQMPDEPEGTSAEDVLSEAVGAARSPVDGVVMAVSPSEVIVRDRQGKEHTVELYENYPHSRKTFVHNQPIVKAGDEIRKGGLIAPSNFTDKEGRMAMGLNVRAAYIPMGRNFEDAFVVSESFAKRATSQHAYQFDADWKNDLTQPGKRPYLQRYPSRFKSHQLETLDDDGVVKPGTTLQPGDPLIVLATIKADPGTKVHRKGDRSWADRSVVWEHHDPATVVDVVKTDEGPRVLVRSDSPLRLGDKLAPLHGDKGVVAEIIPDELMPHDEEGKPFEVVFDSHSLVSRTNAAQVVEAVLGKIAAKTGKPYVLPSFQMDRDNVQFMKEEMAKHGVSDAGVVTDPQTGRRVPSVLTGMRWIMKLHHSSESKLQGRGAGGGYSADEAPSKSGPTGAKRLALLESNAILAHGAYNVLRDALSIRGQKNEAWWLRYMQGQTPPPAKVPIRYEKFLSELQASGIRVKPEGNSLRLMALRNQDVEELAGGRELKNAETAVIDRDGKIQPVAGGLFDPELTGGFESGRWSYIKLPEAIPNPVFEDPIRHLLGMTKKQLEDVVAGGEVGGIKGPQGLQQALGRLNVDQEMARARVAIASGKKGKRDDAVRRLGYLMGLKQTGMSPADWMLDKVPVLPPQFRPVGLLGDSGVAMVSDPNYLYRELFESAKNLKDLRTKVDDVSDERRAVYNSFRALTGLEDPAHPKLREKGVKGILGHVFASSPKFNSVQRRLISSTVDNVGRGVIIPDTNLDMDSVGIPENKAWEVYKPFLARRLYRKGMPLVRAMHEIKEKSEVAKKELVEEMASRPVLVSRAPVWHKYGIMAFYPKLVKGDAIRISPLIVSGFGADFDGDAMNYHAIADDDAAKEAAERMLPSRNLIATDDLRSPMHMPSKQFLAGLFAGTEPGGRKSKQSPTVFRSKADLARAYEQGKISYDDPVIVADD